MDKHNSFLDRQAYNAYKWPAMLHFGTASTIGLITFEPIKVASVHSRRAPVTMFLYDDDSRVCILLNASEPLLHLSVISPHLFAVCRRIFRPVTMFVNRDEFLIRLKISNIQVSTIHSDGQHQPFICGR